VTLTVQRDLSVLRAGLERWLGRPVGEVTRPAPGWSCETLIVEADLVVRLPPAGEGIFPIYDLAQQAAVQATAGAAGVPVAAPVRYEPDPSFLGAPFVAMPFVRGPIPSEFTPADPWLQGLADDTARRTVWHSFLEAVARVHAVPTDGVGSGLRAGVDADLDFWEGYLDWATDASPPPPLADALEWCRSHRPGSEPAGGLLWGDVRLGNVVFDPYGLAPKALLDWDMTAIGPAEMDIAWFLALEAVQTDLTGMSVPGFGTRDEAVAVVERLVGRELVDLEWYEIFALVRASAVSTRIAILFERAGQASMFKIGQDPTLAAALTRIAAG
jgi:aminoglycoside phosphotransferase (APT) family kinase protein